MEHSATGSRASSLGRSVCLNANSMISLFFTIFEVLAVLLASHFNGQPLTVDHGAQLRLLVPLKLGLKNVKAITKITIPRKSREATGLNVDIPVTTESNAPSYRTAVY
jgi:DMSO/TMAO reductase YedYZ molybdopterin-dependent catalytic subunit